MSYIFAVTNHTDYVGTGTTFVVQEGEKSSGLEYIDLAIAKGATKIVLPKGASWQAPKNIESKNIEIEYCDDTRYALSELSAQAYNFPASKLEIIGVTGTKGKTSSVFLLYHMLKKLNYKVALISGVYCEIFNERIKNSLTTPQPDFLHWFFDKAVKAGITHVVMETSAQAISLSRVAHIKFKVGLFTNFSSEHLEFYSDLEEYFLAKSQLRDLSEKFIINIDDEWCKRLANFDHVQKFSEVAGDFVYKVENVFPVSILFQNCVIKTNLVGKFNAANLAGVITVLVSFGIKLESLENILADFKGVPGRMEIYELANGAKGVIDYAHNPSSYASFLPTVRDLTKDLIVVFGCGGARDPKRRPVMGGLAATYADKVILTIDNCRDEDPEDIVKDILSGIDNNLKNKVTIVLDRSQAIKKAYELSNAGSLIAVLGKGPDEYQQIGKDKFFFSDYKELAKFFLVLFFFG